MTTPLPDNLISRIARAYVDSRQFTDDSGKTVNYDKFVVEISIKDEPYNLEFKLDRKDKAILSLSDELES
jgi:hypothetical protein